MVRECDAWMQPQLRRWQEKCWCADILVRSSLLRAVDLPEQHDSFGRSLTRGRLRPTRSTGKPQLQDKGVPR